MDKSTAQRVVTETFNASFDRERFRNFVNELTNGFDETKKQTMQVPDAFKPHVSSCQRIGTYKSAESELADVLIVQLTESYKLERTRTALRDFVAHKLKRGDGEDNAYKEAALVAFVSPDSKSWRFSFVRMEYETKRDPKTGKIKPEERLTPARRYSYLVGAEEQCHTAQIRFLALLQDTKSSPTLAQIEEAFSVESVTKEFFDQYAALFQRTHAALEAIMAKDKAVKTDFQAKNVCTVDFAKKLLGQIVFLYFIQKKGWLGVPKGGNWGDGPKNFMRLLADRSIAEGKCLFNDVLEPLFYDTLATDRGHEAWCKPFACRIPFLNGGLFEPLSGYDWAQTNLAFSNDLFTNQQLTKEGDTGTGILDVFDRYNFTVNEAEPLEKEVAIDPEMLGKVFENLIEENRRKGLGAYYTPREIVHYMCQESLINYLDTTLNSSTDIPVCSSFTNNSSTDIPVCSSFTNNSSTDIPVCSSFTNTDRNVCATTRRNLPHWTKDGAIYWITFRLADSLPQEKLKAWCAERDIWCAHHPEPWSEEDWNEYDERFGERFQTWLDTGHGSCALARPEIRQILEDSLLRFDGERLSLHAGVIMPNHVHLLLEPLAGNTLSELLKGIKGASARKANQILGSTGTTFWQEESYDHIVRSQRQYEHFLRYIAENPVKANLAENKFWLYQSSTDIPVCSANESQAQERPQTRMSVLRIPRADIETFIREGDQAAHYETARKGGTVSYARKLPKPIETHARALDDALKSITVCDPAIGSGAFPVGMMTEIVKARSALTPYFNDIAERTPYHFKRHAIQNSIYGVDIDAGAVEIAKLRLWLSLVVDEEDVKQIKPLPNLDYKVVIGNSLMGFPFKSRRIHTIEKLKVQYFDETDHDRKIKLREEINTEIAAAFANSKKSLGYEVSFDFEIFFSEVFHAKNGFDVVIANPPYVRHETISDQAPILRQRYKVAASRADLLIFFYEQGANLLRPNGVLTLITSNKYYRAGYGSKLRPFLSGNLTIFDMVDFGDAPVFEAIAYASILIGKKCPPASDHAIRACTWPLSEGFDRLRQTLQASEITLAQSDLAADGWRLENPAAIRLLEKLRAKGTPLGKYVNGKFYYGIKTGFNEAFVIDAATRNRLIAEDKKSAELIKPFLRGRDVKRWIVHHHDLYLIVFPFGFHKELEKYPAILRHLTQFETQLKKRGQCTSSRGGKEGGQHHWLELDNNPKVEYLESFTEKKVVMPAIERSQAFAVDFAGHYSNDKTNICVCDHAEVLCAVLNSSTLWWALTQTAATKQNGYYEFKPLYMRQLPIPPADTAIKKKLSSLAEKAAKLREANHSGGVATIEREIDTIVYQLFDLTSAEISLIETALAPVSGNATYS